MVEHRENYVASYMTSILPHLPVSWEGGKPTWSAEQKKRVLVFFHDESTFHPFDYAREKWHRKDLSPIQKGSKGLGPGVMVSDFMGPAGLLRTHSVNLTDDPPCVCCNGLESKKNNEILLVGGVLDSRALAAPQGAPLLTPPPPPSPPSLLHQCDFCNCGFHQKCCQPAVPRVPEGLWYCEDCLSLFEAEGVDPAPRSPLLLLEPSKEGWFDRSKFIAQIKQKVIPLLKYMTSEGQPYAEATEIHLMFDNSSGHRARAPDALDSSVFNLRDPAKCEPPMRDGE